MSKMRKLSIDEIKGIELDILVDVAAFCERNKIDYFISCGTLLGAVRHNGFIPWDDDSDITMPRDSYEKFISTYHSDKGFKVVSANENVRYNRAFARVMSMKTTRSKHKRLNFDYRICIDVFPMDFFDSEQQAKDIYKHLFPERNKEQSRMPAISKTKEIIKKSFVWTIARPIVSRILTIAQHLEANRNARRMDRYIRENHGQKGKFVSSVLAPVNRMPEIFKYSEIFPTLQSGSFEGHIFRVPNDADRYLSLLYGDYMNPPPVEKRKPCHYRDVYVKER